MSKFKDYEWLVERDWHVIQRQEAWSVIMNRKISSHLVVAEFCQPTEDWVSGNLHESLSTMIALRADYKLNLEDQRIVDWLNRCKDAAKLIDSIDYAYHPHFDDPKSVLYGTMYLIVNGA